MTNTDPNAWCCYALRGVGGGVLCGWLVLRETGLLMLSCGGGKINPFMVPIPSPVSILM